MDFSAATRETARVAEAIPSPDGKAWDIKTRFIDLMEEVGELANAILLEHGNKTEKRRRAELVDSVCDVLFDLLLIAEHYGIELDKEYPKVLEHLMGRAERGEF